MRRNLITPLLFLSIAAAVAGLAGCGSGPAPIEEAPQDSLAVSDSTAQALPQAASEQEADTVVRRSPADRNFVDFLSLFTRDRAFQRQRIEFPIAVSDMGTERRVGRNDWRNGLPYALGQTYCLLYNDAAAADNTDVERIDTVTVEWLDAESSQMRLFGFHRLKSGAWVLDRVRIANLDEYRDAGFVHVLQHFATDSAFQEDHLSTVIKFGMPDPDDETEYLDGEIAKEQWDVFRPELPKGPILNIDFGQPHQAQHHERVVCVQRLRSAEFCRLFFRRVGDSWHLYRFES